MKLAVFSAVILLTACSPDALRKDAEKGLPTLDAAGDCKAAWVMMPPSQKKLFQSKAAFVRKCQAIDWGAICVDGTISLSNDLGQLCGTEPRIKRLIKMVDG